MDYINQWHRDLSGIMGSVQKAGTSATKRQSVINKIKEKIKYVREDVVIDMMARLTRTSELPQARSFLKKYAGATTAAAPDLRELRNKILLETIQVGSFGYAHFPCRELLSDAVRFGLFPDGEKDAQYQKLDAAVKAVKPREF